MPFVNDNFINAKKIVQNIFVTHAALAQLVEQGTENPCVLGSIPRRGTT